MLTITITSPTGDQTLILDESSLAGDGALIGRIPGFAIQLDDPKVSRKHAKLITTAGRLQLVDLGSTGGTHVAGIRVPAHQPKDLQDGDELVVGNTRIRISIDHAATGTALAATMIGSPPAAVLMPLAGVAPADVALWDGGEIPLRVVRIVAETHDVKTFTLVADRPTRFHYVPGQFCTLHLTIAGKPVRRSYTISSTPSRPYALTITVKRVAAAEGHASGVVSNHLHDHLQVGQVIPVSGPYGDFTCANHPAAKMLLLSGGSGITPMLSMVRWLHDTGATCDVIFAHSARSPADLIARDELEALARRDPGLRLVFWVSRPEALSAWSGITGRLSIEMLKMHVPDLAERRVFCCGPAPFMASAKELLAADGFSMDHYHEESFGGPTAAAGAGALGEKTSAKAGIAAAPPRKEYGLKALLKGSLSGTKDDGEPTPVPKPFDQRVRSGASGQGPAKAVVSAKTIRFTKSNKTVSSDGGTILECGEAGGLSLPFGCRMGKCGACKAKVVSGAIQRTGYDDGVLNPKDRGDGFVLCCIAKAEGSIEIQA